MHLYLDHAWMRELGEALPAYRPPLDHRLMLAGGAAGRRRRRAGGHAALPDAALEVVDPLRVPGQPAHAHAVPRRLGALDEPAGRRGDRRRATTTGSRRTTATASSSRARSSRTACRRACACMYHSKDRQIGTPRIADRRPPRRHRERADDDRDEADAHGRRLRPAVVGPELLRARRAPTATRSTDRPQAHARRSSTDARPGAGRDGHEPRQVHRLPHLLGHLQAGVDEPARAPSTCGSTTSRPRPARATRASGPTRRAGTAAGSSTGKGRLRLKARRPAQEAADDLLQPRPARDRRLLRAVHLRLRDARQRAARRTSTRSRARTRS